MPSSSGNPPLIAKLTKTCQEWAASIFNDLSVLRSCDATNSFRYRFFFTQSSAHNYITSKHTHHVCFPYHTPGRRTYPALHRTQFAVRHRHPLRQFTLGCVSLPPPPPIPPCILCFRCWFSSLISFLCVCRRPQLAPSVRRTCGAAEIGTSAPHLAGVACGTAAIVTTSRYTIDTPT